VSTHGREQRAGRARGSPLAKYLILQIPGWIFASLVLGFLVHRDDLSLRTGGILFALWIVKDFVLFPIVRVGYESGDPGGTDSLLGALGTARERLDPEGYVRVGSELWRARIAEGVAPVEPGAAVRVIDVHELTLHVEPA
jgi:membrane-bound ClpP family serine protease